MSEIPHPTRRGHGSRPRMLGALLLSLGLVYLVLFAYAVHPGLPYNPIKLPYERELSTSLFLPEGWKFFTRNPQEEQMLPFLRDDAGEWRSASSGPHSMPSHLFGLDRVGRAQGIEIGLLMAAVPDESWQPCKESPVVCLEGAKEAARVHNTTPDATLCGVVGIVLQKPIPWAWVASSPRLIMPSRVARLRVQC